MIATVNSKN